MTKISLTATKIYYVFDKLFVMDRTQCVLSIYIVLKNTKVCLPFKQNLMVMLNVK